MPDKHGFHEVKRDDRPQLDASDGTLCLNDWGGVMSDPLYPMTAFNEIQRENLFYFAFIIFLAFLV